VDYAEFKLLTEAYLGLDKDALHIHGGLLLYFGALFVFRQTHRSRVPWLLVLVVGIANEGADFIGHHLHIIEAGYEALPFPWRDSVRDLWNTMLWPTVILIMSRYTSLFERRIIVDGAEAAEPADD
jgi:hypothetical protein